MTLRTLSFCAALGLAAGVGCGDDSAPSDPSGAATTGGTDPGTDSADPTADPGTDSADPTADPGTDSADPGTDSADPTTGRGTDDGTDAGTGDSTGAADDTGTTGANGDGMTTWTMDVEVDLGGTFEVTSEVVIEIEDGAFSSDVMTLIIAGGKEVHEIPLAGAVDGNTLTMLDSPFSIVVGGVQEDFLLSGQAVIEDGTITGGGDFTSSFDGGKPFPGSFTILGATLVE
ncbi:MAG: hypothetical protein AAGA54_23020 [Myxococcota bacterium]